MLKAYYIREPLKDAAEVSQPEVVNVPVAVSCGMTPDSKDDGMYVRLLINYY